MALWHNESTTSITLNNADDEYEIFPVPARDYLNIDFSGDIDGIKVYNTNGKLMISQKANGMQGINISKLIPGLYFIEIETTNRYFSDKFLKIE